MHTGIPVLFLLPSFGFPQVSSLSHLLLGQTFIPGKERQTFSVLLRMLHLTPVHKMHNQKDLQCTCLECMCLSPSTVTNSLFPYIHEEDHAIAQPDKSPSSAQACGCKLVCKRRGDWWSHKSPWVKKACTLLQGVTSLKASKESGWYLLAGVPKRSDIAVGGLDLTRTNWFCFTVY